MSDFIVKRQCERCPSVEEIQVSAEDIKSGKYKPEPTAVKYSVLVDGKPLASYSRLCEACDEAVSKAILDIARKREKKTSKRS